MHNKEVCNNETAALNAQRLTCVGTDGSGGHQREFEDKRQECDDFQGQLESATCAYVSKVDDTCESFATCTNSLVDALDGQVAAIQAAETQRKVEWNATERLLCLLGAYGADGGVNASRLQTCQHVAENTSHLNLNYPTPTARPSPCPDLLHHPCGDDYTAEEYGGLDAPAATCTPCTFPNNANGGPGGSSPSPQAPTPPPISCGHRALRFTTYNTYISLPTVTIGGSMTVSAWVYQWGDPSSQNWGRIIDFGGYGWSQGDIYFTLDGTSGKVGYCCLGRIYDNEKLPENAWVNVAMVLDGPQGQSGEVKIYRNGQEVASGTAPLPQRRSYTQNYISRAAYGGQYLDVSMDQIMVWDRALTPEEIQNVADGQGPATDLFAHWNFEENSGSAILDVSGNGRHATLHGAERVDSTCDLPGCSQC